MTPQTRERMLRLARKQFPLNQIASQCGVTTDTARRTLRLAETAGELPAGAVKACGIRRRQVPAQAVPDAAADIQVFAPARSHAAQLGPCSACSDPTDVVVRCGDVELRLCRLHTPRLAHLLQEAGNKASARRTVFNGGCRT